MKGAPARAAVLRPLGSYPQRCPLRLHPQHATIARERCQPLAPFRRGAHFVLIQATDPEQRVMQFLGVDRIGPCFGTHAGDRLGIEPAQVAKRQPQVDVRRDQAGVKLQRPRE